MASSSFFAESELYSDSIEIAVVCHRETETPRNSQIFLEILLKILDLLSSENLALLPNTDDDRQIIRLKPPNLESQPVKDGALGPLFHESPSSRNDTVPYNIMSRIYEIINCTAVTDADIIAYELLITPRTRPDANNTDSSRGYGVTSSGCLVA